ncbi:MAG: hypothetical protein ACK5RA_13855 [Cyanobacteriota bacterium]
MPAISAAASVRPIASFSSAAPRPRRWCSTATASRASTISGIGWHGPVGCQREANQEAVQGLFAAIKGLHGMAGQDRFDPVAAHPAPPDGG